ncbi:MAG: hypothetical protein JST84_05550 [Acidobacteria bacterium]|nr:hypothetical protein [Acidobacteriota bacterium]
MPATNLGKPCWEIGSIAKVISSVAQLDAEYIEYFLATHAPIKHIRHDETQELLDEERFFQELIKQTHGEVLAVIHGDPGTGKSHLIHWLKLRCADGLTRQEISNVRPVLIQRRTGSLKDALEQMIQQLPQDFAHYLTPVKSALEKISDVTAREKLVGELYLELGTRRADAGRAPLPRHLRYLPHACGGSTGFRQWLCREGGVIDRVIKLLTQQSEVDEREGLPQFVEQEFNITEARYRNKARNTEEVYGLIEDFLDEPSLREDAASYFNEVLPNAVKEMTGLAGTRLRDVFDQIRADLKRQGEELALFIEDVSVMSALDEEVFVALEPQKRQGLCRMIAVVGVTNQGWNRLPHNQKQRVTHPVSVGGQMTEEWCRDPQAVAEFTARYLNALRLAPDDVSTIARHRRNGRDVTISACERCQVRQECHEVFGAVEIENLDIGLFPLTNRAPQRMLINLQDGLKDRKNQRGLLAHILQPILDKGHEDLEAGIFPSFPMAVELPPPTYWTGFEARFCGGWNETDRKHLKFLAQFWVDARDTDDAAEKLQPFLTPLGFQQFSKKVGEATPAIKPVSPRQAIVEKREQKTTQEITRPADQEKLYGLLHNLDKWAAGDVLVGDQEARQMLADLIRKALPWDDQRFPPLEVWKTLLGEGSNYKFINIDGMRSKLVGTKFSIRFERTKETRDLMEALTQYQYAGNRSWNFPHGEMHKRTVAAWVRKHSDGIIRHLQPQNGLDIQMPVTCAVQLLATTALIERRTRLSQELPELIKRLLSSGQDEPPVALSKEWKQLVDDMRIKRHEIKLFLLTEVNVPQGRRAREINFINPLPIIQEVIAYTSDPKITPPGNEYNKDFWQTRYAVFEKADKYAELATALDQEKAAINNLVEGIILSLRSAGYNTGNISEALTNYCADLTEVIQALRKANFPVPDKDFDELGRKVFVERQEVWVTAITKAQDVTKAEDLMSVLLFNPKNLKEASDCLEIAEKYRSVLEKVVEVKLRHIEQEGDPDQLAAELLQSLEAMAAIIEDR